MFKEFKEFIARGSVMDMAVGVIIGAAFGKIVSSLVDDILMPIIGKLMGGISFESLQIVLSEESAIRYGSFIQQIVDFLIIAMSIFLIIRLVNKLSRKKEQEAAAPEPPAPSSEELLLTEIRDLLKKQ